MKFINVFKPSLSFKDYFSVLKYLLKNEISGNSQVVKDFEEEFKKVSGKKYCTVVSNGSVALDVAFLALNLPKNSEVILPSHTIISCLSPIIRNNLVPVFCDIDIKNWNTSLENIKPLVSNKTSAILMVHLYGLTAEAKEIREFCNQRKLHLIEDGAEAHGQIYGNSPIGSFGDISTFSFYANKHITMGEGGAVCTDDIVLDNKIRQIINLDFIPEKRFFHSNLYWNYRLSGLQAALGLSQIKSLEKTIKNKIKQAMYYFNLLEQYEKYFFLPEIKSGTVLNNFWIFGIVLKVEGIRDQIIENLKNSGIETRPFFYPLHKQPAVENINFRNGNLKNSEFLGENGLYLPLGRHITKRKQRKIISLLITEVNQFL